MLSLIIEGIKCILWDSPGREILEVCSGFFRTLLHALFFPFTDLVLHSFVINHSCESNCILSLVNPATESSLFSMNLNCHPNINTHIYVETYGLSTCIPFNFSQVVLPLSRDLTKILKFFVGKTLSTSILFFFQNSLDYSQACVYVEINKKFLNF